MRCWPYRQRTCCGTAGCVVGNNAGAIVASSPRNADLWSGKCFDKWGTNGLPTGVTNAITLGKELIVSAAACAQLPTALNG